MTTGIRVYAEVLMGSSPLLGVAASSYFLPCGQRHLGAEIEKLDAFWYFSSLARVPLVAKLRHLLPVRGNAGPPLRQAHFAGSPGGLCIMNAMARAYFRVTLARSDRVVKLEYATRTDLRVSRRRSRLGRSPRRHRALGDRRGRRDGERGPDEGAGRRDERARVRGHGPARRAATPHRKSASVGDDRDRSRRQSPLRYLHLSPPPALPPPSTPLPRPPLSLPD